MSNDNHTVNICHRTGGHYVSDTVDQSSVEHGTGHGGHADDIIDTFPGYGGQNLGNGGQYLLSHDCQSPPSTTTTTTTRPTTTSTLPPGTTTTVTTQPAPTTTQTTTTIRQETTTTLAPTTTTRAPSTTLPRPTTTVARTDGTTVNSIAPTTTVQAPSTTLGTTTTVAAPAQVPAHTLPVTGLPVAASLGVALALVGGGLVSRCVAKYLGA